MKYEFLEDTATADVAFNAYGKDLNELFQNAALALAACTVNNLDSLPKDKAKEVELTADSMDQLLIDFLGELIFIKDTLHLVFNDITAEVSEQQEHAHIRATLKGTKLDQEKHELGNDVKAVTYHNFKLEKTDKGYKCHVILDI